MTPLARPAHGLAAAATFVAMLLTGAFHTSETARGCLFVYPLCLLPLAALVEDGALDEAAQHRLRRFVAAQSIVMRARDDYLW